ncbi:MAG: sugar nucleotide-binding protein [Candidatus Gracilibacteria bacterium]
MKILIYGKGFLGNHFLNFFNAQGETSLFGNANIGDIDAVRKDLAQETPDVVLNCAGKTGRPNVDWCEDHKQETLYSNVTGPLVLLQACLEKNIYFAHLGSGCIYDGDNNGKGFSEEDKPNFDGSYYSRTKTASDQALKEFPVLQLRIRMPIDSAPGPRNFITKILQYEKVVSVANSMTVIDDLLPTAYELIKRHRTGIYNMTNPGLIDHATILDLYKEIVDPNFKYTVIPLEELYSKNYATAKRSNCMLNTDKLAKEGLAMRPIEAAVRDCLEKGFKKHAA